MGCFTESEALVISQRYDITKAIRHMGGDRNVDAGYEVEIGAEVAKRQGRPTRGLAVPDCVLVAALNRRRAFDTSTATAIIPTINRDDWMSCLFAKAALGRAGVQTVSGCVGNIKFPRGGAVTPYWITTEGGNATESNPNFATGASATIKTVGCYTDVSRKLLLQTSRAVKDFVVAAIAKSVALGVEKAAFSGTGTSGQPVGLDNLTGVHSVSITADAPTRDELIGVWDAVAADNADGETDTFAFISPSAVKSKLLKTSDGHGKYLLERGLVADVAPIFDTNNATAKKIYAGDWSKMLIAAWSGIDLIKDDSTFSTSGNARVCSLLDCDIVCLEPKAFAVGTVLS